MANIGDTCNMVPHTTNTSGEDINSPLYEDLFDIIGDRDRAVSLYQKAISEEIKQQIEDLPSSLVNYYPGTTTPTLATVLNVSDMEKEISEDELLTWLNDKVDYKVETMKDISKIVSFNNSEWNTRFRAYYDIDGIVHIAPHLEQPDNSIPYNAFAEEVYRNLIPLIHSLNMEEDDFNELANDKMSAFQRLMFYRPEDFADLLLNISNFANGKPVKLTCFRQPNIVMAKFLVSYMKSSELYARLLDDLRKDDYYKSYDTSEEFQNLSDEEKLQTAALRIIASTISKERRNAKVTSSKLSTRLVEQFKEKIKTNSKLLPSNIKNIIKAANEKYSIVDETFVASHPLFVGENLSGTEISKIQEVLNELSKLTVKYLSITGKNYTEGKENVSDFEEDNNKWYQYIKTFNEGMTQTDKDMLNNQIRQLILEIDSSARTVETIMKAIRLDANTKTSLSSNNLLCGKLRQATLTLKYLSKMLNELDRINSFQRENNIASEIFTNDIEQLIQKTNSIIEEQKRVIIKTEKNAVINELEATFPNRTFTLPSGDVVDIRGWVENESAAFDIMISERFLGSVEECSNPILTLLDSYKKRAVQEGRDEYQRLSDEVVDAARGLKDKDTSWMFTISKKPSTSKKISSKEFQKKKAISLEQFPNTDIAEEIYYFRENGVTYSVSAEKDSFTGEWSYSLHTHTTPTGKYIMDYDMNAFVAEYTRKIQEVKDRNDISPETKQKLNESIYNELTEVRPDLDGTRYPRRDLYPNTKFQKLSDDQKKYWAVFMKNKAALINMFPERNYGINDVIFIRKTNRDTIVDNVKKSGVKGGFKALRRIINGAWDYTSRDTDIGEETVFTDFDNEFVYQLPIFYTTLHENETIDDISLDTTTALQEYAKVMYNAASLRNVVNILNCAADVIAMTKYKKRTVFEKPKKVFNNVGSHRDTEDFTLPPNSLESLTMYKNWLQMQVYGQRTHKVKRGWRLAANVYMKWVSFGTLALNTLSAVANIVQGLNQLVPAAIGGYFFNLKDLKNACWLYDKYMFPIRKDSGVLEIGGTVMNNKLNLFSRKFNIMQDFNDSVTHFDETRVERLINGNLLYFFLHAGEHYLQHRGAFAMMMNEKNKVMDTNGKFITAFDAYDTVKLPNGGSKLVLKKGLTTEVNGSKRTIITREELAERAANANKSILDKTLLNENEISESEWVSILSQKMAALNHYLHGIYNTEDMNRAQYYMLGKMAIMYRKYLVPSINRRFGVRTHIAGLDSDVEGYYTTLAKFHIRLFKELKGDSNADFGNLNDDLKSIAEAYLEKQGINTFDKKKEAWAHLDKKTRRNILFGKTNIWDVTFGDLSAMEKGNMRTAWGEIGIFFSLVLSNLLLDYIDDDDDTIALAALRYFLRRAQTEVGALTPVSLFLIPFAFINKEDHEELNALSKGTMYNEAFQLFQQPIVGMNHVENIPEILGVVNPENWVEDAKYDKDKFPNEAARLAAKQMTPFRQYKSWTVESLHKKEAWYKQ